MSELIFMVEEDLEGGYSASALGHGIHTQGETVEELKAMIREAVLCFFDEGEERPAVVRLHYVRDELMAL